MTAIVCVQVIWDGHHAPAAPAAYRSGKQLLPVRFLPVRVGPEPEHPVGRKGLALASAWEVIGRPARAAGMLVLDGDVAIDPVHVAAMMECVRGEPGSVWTAPVRIWPVSTHRDDWVWAHWDKQASQEMDDTARWFSFCFTYLPARLLEQAIREGLRTWVYPRVDASVSRVARKMRLTCRVVHCDPPVHLHY